MSTPTEAIAYKGSATGDIVKSTTRVDHLDPDQVLVEIHHSGLCGTDLHYVNQDMVLGHEGAGVVVKTGPAVRRFKVGDRVGFGYIHDGCGYCVECLRGDYGHCLNSFHRFGYTELDQGGFATHAVWRERLLFKIPDGLSTENAAPLMCAGITVFNPFARYNIPPTSRVGVVGIGGLGHLAIQFAAKWGCEVVVFSSTDSKKDEALKLGATEFVTTKGKDKLDVSHKVNHLLITTSQFPNWGPLLDTVAPFGAVYLMSVDTSELKLPFMKLLTNDIAIRSTTVGSYDMFNEMFNFAVRHKIKPMTQKFPLTEDGMKKAREALEGGHLRYKAVFEVKA
jgi:D-arabinose 1-dehydrogenase-like Zn-dependent alcohol dehydrogenase